MKRGPVLLRLSIDGVLERFTLSVEIATVAEKEQFHRFQSNVARMSSLPLEIAHLNVYTLKTDRRRCRWL